MPEVSNVAHMCHAQRYYWQCGSIDSNTDSRGTVTVTSDVLEYCTENIKDIKNLEILKMLYTSYIILFTISYKFVYSHFVRDFLCLFVSLLIIYCICMLTVLMVSKGISSWMVLNASLALSCRTCAASRFTRPSKISPSSPRGPSLRGARIALSTCCVRKR